MTSRGKWRGVEGELRNRRQQHRDHNGRVVHGAAFIRAKSRALRSG
jgi:hypothetical protein